MEVRWQAPDNKNLRSVLHIGAGKCGSSSIQSFLSHHPSLKTGPFHSKLTYACLSKNGLKTESKIERNLKRQVSGYVSSPGVAKLSHFAPRRKSAIKDLVAAHPDDLIFSCEGWLQALRQPDAFNLILDLVAPQESQRNVELIAFVRPPVKWINSAWWQWGAWENSDFESWLETSLGAVQWFRYLSQAKDFPSVTSLTVEPIYQNVVHQLIDILDIQEIDHVNTPTNQSLPTEVLELFSLHRQHRPSAHVSFNDFLVGHVIASNTNQYNPTPWVLSPQHIRRILEATHDSNHQLLELMDEPSKQRILNDPHWWQEDAYSHLNNAPPFPQPNSTQASPYLLASDLLTSLGKAIEIFKSKGLLQSYLDSLADAQNNQSNSKDLHE